MVYQCPGVWGFLVLSLLFRVFSLVFGTFCGCCLLGLWVDFNIDVAWEIAGSF